MNKAESVAIEADTFKANESPVIADVAMFPTSESPPKKASFA